MGLFGAHFDESGTHEGARILVVAGYVAPADQLKKLESAWWHTLANSGLDPTKESFHMAPFESRNQPHMKGKTPFYAWPAAKADAFLAQLLQIMEQRITFGVAIAIVENDYEDWRRASGSDLSPYAFAAIRCLHRTAATMDARRLKGDIAYIFGDGVEGSEQVNRAAASMLADKEWRKEYRVASLGFGGVLKYLALQAADIGVWETRRYVLTARDRNNAGMRLSLQRIIGKIPHYTEFYDGAGLIAFNEEFRRHRIGEMIEAGELIETDTVDAWPALPDV